MRKLGLILLFLFFHTEVLASPARFGGFSYRKDEYGRVILNEGSEIFNEGPIQLEEEPEPPYYLDEDQLPSQSQDKYQLIYTMDDVYRELETTQKKTSINYKIQDEKYTTPPVYSMKDLHEGKINKSSKNSDEEEEYEEEEYEEEYEYEEEEE